MRCREVHSTLSWWFVPRQSFFPRAVLTLHNYMGAAHMMVSVLLTKLFIPCSCGSSRILRRP